MANYVSPLSAQEDPALSSSPGIFYPAPSYRWKVGQEISRIFPVITRAGFRRLIISPEVPRTLVPALTLPHITPQTSPMLPVNGTPIEYRSPEFSLSPVGNSKLDVYLPDGDTPATGWPVVLTSQLAAFIGLPVRGELLSGDIFSNFFFKIVNSGVAVIDMGISSSGLATPAIAPPAWFTPPGTANWADFNQRMPEQDVVQAIQWIKETGVDAPYNLDPLRIIVNGASAGQIIGAWVAYHENLAVPDGSSAQIQQRTDDIRAISSMLPVYDLDVYFDHNWIDIVRRFESVSSPGTDCDDMADADPDARAKGTPSWALHMARSRGWEIPILFIGDEGTVHFKPDDWHKIEFDGKPWTKNYIGTTVHDSWNAGHWIHRLRTVAPEFHRKFSRLWWRSNFADNFDPVARAELDFIYESDDGILDGISDEIRLKHRDWVYARATESFPHPHGVKFNPWSGAFWGKADVAFGPTEFVIHAEGCEFSTKLVLEAYA